MLASTMPRAQYMADPLCPSRYIIYLRLKAFASYKGGIFQGCAGDKKQEATDCQAVAAVGYGSENGIDYWIMKNSRGAGWGEAGYFRLQRGVRMCHVGKSIGVIKCGIDGNSLVAACRGGKCNGGEEKDDEEEDEEEEEEEVEEGDESDNVAEEEDIEEDE